MDDAQRSAQEWRDRAIALRALAKHMTHPVARDELLEVASRWETRAAPAGAGFSFSRLFDSRKADAA